MKSILRNIFFTRRLAISLCGLVLLFITAYWFPILFFFSKLVLIIFLGYCFYELAYLFNRNNDVEVVRSVPKKLSNGDLNEIELQIRSGYNRDIHIHLFDELPVQFQDRTTSWKFNLNAKQGKIIQYHIRPLKRGDYSFGAVVVLISALGRLFERRMKFDQEVSAPVYPSYLHMRRYELTAFGNVKRASSVVVNKKLGHGMEFEQIKEYVQGDPQRWINWKATGRHQQLMVNQYSDELSKDIWCFLDKGRLMKMPFEGLSLLDYAINAVLAVSHIALKAGDHAGLLTFSNKLSTIIPPSKKSTQMNAIMEALYNQRTRYMESNYDLMTKYIKSRIRKRSLILLFTNFETIPSFRRQLENLKRLVRLHIVVVFFFENTEVTGLLNESAESLRDIYYKSVAEDVLADKQTIIAELRSAGIFAVYVKPNELSLKAVNRFMQIRTSGML